MSNKVKINYFDLGLHTGNEMHGIVETFNTYPNNSQLYNFQAYGFEACSLTYKYCKSRFKKYDTVKVIHGAITDKEGPVRLYYAENDVGHSIYKSKNEALEQSNGLDEKTPFQMPTYLGEHYFDTNDKSLVIEYLTRNGRALANEENFRVVRLRDGLLYVHNKNDDPPYHFVRTGPRQVHEDVDGVVFSKWLKKNIDDIENSFNILRVNIEGAEWNLFNDLVDNNLVKHFDVFCGDGDDVKKIPEIPSDDYYQLLKENDIQIYRFTDWHPERNEVSFKMLLEKMKKYEKSEKNT